MRHKHKLEPREKNHVCGSVKCTCIWCCVYAPVACKGIAIACKRNTLQVGLENINKNEKVRFSSQLDACHHLSDDCHHDEDERDEAADLEVIQQPSIMCWADH